MATWTKQEEKAGGNVANWDDSVATWGGEENEWDGNVSTIWTNQDDETTS